jgi:parallel beta-helix repeat protein
MRCRIRLFLEPLEPRIALAASQALSSLSWLASLEQAFLDSQGTVPAMMAAPTVELHPGDSIQDAVDHADPGTIILLDPGTYTQTIEVTRPGIIIAGRGGAAGVILSNPGDADNGIQVDAGVTNFALVGVTVEGFGSNGVLLDHVQQFAFIGNQFINDGDYGLFPSLCSTGLIFGNIATGNRDTGIYVGQSINVAVMGNSASGNVNGIEVENSINVSVFANTAIDNTVGILVDLLPGLDVKFASNTTVTDNLVLANNHPNFGNPSDIASVAPSGVGIFVLGTNATTVSDNTVLGNATIGIGVASSTLLTLLDGTSVNDIQPLATNTHVANNMVQGLFGGADLVWDGMGINNTWTGNTFQTVVSPVPLPGA